MTFCTIYLFFVLVQKNLPQRESVATAPIPKNADKGVLYYATKVGTRLTYDIDGHEHTEIIAEVDVRNGAKLVTVGSESMGKIVPRRIVSVSESGLSVVGTDVLSLDEPFLILRLPAAPNGRWETAFSPTGFEKAIAKMSTTGVEKITVPAGTFNAIRVEMDMKFLGSRRQSTAWYAPRLGLLKEVNGTSVKALKSVKVGKD